MLIHAYLYICVHATLKKQLPADRESKIDCNLSIEDGFFDITHDSIEPNSNSLVARVNELDSSSDGSGVEEYDLSDGDISHQ